MSAEHGTNTFTIELPEDVLTKFAETPEAFAREVRLAAAMLWYTQGRISHERAARLAGVSRIAFIDALAAAKLPAFHVDVDELMEEVESARQADREHLAPRVPGAGEPAGDAAGGDG
jgi:predicted HTH domain antitoxin